MSTRTGAVLGIVTGVIIGILLTVAAFSVFSRHEVHVTAAGHIVQYDRWTGEFVVLYADDLALRQRERDETRRRLNNWAP